MNKNIITIGGSEEFTDTEMGLKFIDEAVKKNKIPKKDLVVYGWSPKSVGAYLIAKAWATKNKAEFRDGNPKSETRDDWSEVLAYRNKTLSECSKLLINLCVGTSTGGKGFIDAFKALDKPIETINEKPVTATDSDAKSKRSGTLPTEAELARSMEIFSGVAQKLLNYGCLMLDTETTGLDKDDEVIEIAMADCKTEVEVFNSLIYSDKESNKFAFEVNKITKEMLEGKPTIGEVWPQIEAVVGNRVLLASNSSFDERLLNQSLAKFGLTCSFIWQDIQTLYRAYSCQGDARKFPLKTLGMCKQLGITAGTHRAMTDVIAQIKILKAMADKVVPEFDA